MSAYTPRARFFPLLGCWYITDDGLSWYALPRTIKREETAKRYAVARFG